MVENWAESATTVKPHTRPIASASHADHCATSPIATAHDPDATIIAAVVWGRPQRSPSNPPATQPNAPAPITAKVAYAAPAPGPCTARKKTTNHAHIAYSSHMCPK